MHFYLCGVQTVHVLPTAQHVYWIIRTCTQGKSHNINLIQSAINTCEGDPGRVMVG